jgi:hypothetical protein
MESLNNLLRKQYVSEVLSAVILLYIGASAISFPPSVTKMFDSVIVKFLVCFVLAYCLTKNVRQSVEKGVIFTVLLVIYEKFKNEMMVPSLGSEPSDKDDDLTGCNCRSLNDLKPKTKEGKYVMDEVKKSVDDGTLSPDLAHKYGHNVLQCEKNNVPVLTGMTSEGVTQIDEISVQESLGTLSPDQAKQYAAKVVVNEVVNIESVNDEQNKENEIEPDDYYFSGFQELPAYNGDINTTQDPRNPNTFTY